VFPTLFYPDSGGCEFRRLSGCWWDIRVKTMKQVVLASSNPGKVREITVAEGQTVQEGDTVAVID